MKIQSNILTLGEGWKLVHDKDNVGKTEKWYRHGIPTENAVDAKVPGFVHLFLPDCRGVAWYELEFANTLKATENDLYIIKFAMAEWYTEVYLNGRLVGTHEGCEDPFEFDITNIIKKGKNRFDIRVSKPYGVPADGETDPYTNNRKMIDVDGYNFYKIPHRNEIPTEIKPGQCHNSYGLCGEINLVVTPRLFIEDSFIFANTKTGNIEIQYTVQNRFDKPVRATLDTECSIKRTGEPVNSDKYTADFGIGKTVVKRKVKIDGFLWWDINDPNLYNVYMSLSTDKTCHKTVKHCGFRTFEVNEENGYFYLNGRRILLRCSHTGNCMPESTVHISRKKELLRRDFVMAKAVGFNCVRFISGCALPEQLDYCDEIGLMLYEEPKAGWCMHDSDRAEGFFRHDLFTMIKRDRSHPSLVMTGFLNETSTRPPFNKTYLYARKALKDARKLDNTRLFIYSSGRFDDKCVSGDLEDPWCGSFANPGRSVWQCLWNEDSEDKNYYPALRKAAGLPEKPVWKCGDVHSYPSGPIPKWWIKEVSGLGKFSKRPVLVSEIGTGSMFNVLWLQRKYEEMNADQNAPDVRTVNKMAKEFLENLRRFGFEDEYAYPIDILRQSEELNNRQRQIIFNVLRGNGYINGISLTGLLDHSICGEGLFTFMREYKPGMADTLQNGFAPVRWCLFTDQTHGYRNRPFGVEAVLANEDVLKAGKYPVSIKITAEDRSVVYSKDIELVVTEEDTKTFSIPVFRDNITLDVPTGAYELRAELLSGAAATDGKVKFYITDPNEIKATVKSVVGVCLSDSVKAFLTEKGIKVTDLEGANGKSLILVGVIPDEEKEAVWDKLTDKIKCGARVFAADYLTFEKDRENTCAYMPVEHKPIEHPGDRGNSDWLYHKEYFLKRNHPYFEGLPAGMMDLDYFGYVVSSHIYDYVKCDVIPDEIQAIAMSTGLPWGAGKHDDIKADGVELGTYNIGKGSLTICAFDILPNIGANPTADRLLVNILNTEAKKL